MIEKRKVDVLLRDLVEESGVAYLSDLRQISSPRYLFTIFESVAKKDYAIDEWRHAISYIFKLEKYADTEIQDEGIILWNMGQWGQYITEVMENYYSHCKKSGCFYHVTGKYGPKLSAEKKYLLFFPASIQNREEVREYTMREKLNINLVAVCGDYCDGMQAMNNGDGYALKLPLEEKAVIHCYQHFISALKRKDE